MQWSSHTTYTYRRFQQHLVNALHRREINISIVLMVRIQGPSFVTQQSKIIDC